MHVEACRAGPGAGRALTARARRGTGSTPARRRALVTPMWPGIDGGLRGKRVDQGADRLEQRVPVAARAGRCGPPSPGTARRRRTPPARPAIEKVTWPGLWPGVKSTSISKPASSSRSPPSSVCSASHDSKGPKPGQGTKRVDVGQHEGLGLGHPHLGAGGPGHRRHRAHVVEVRVGEQDAVELHAQLVDRAEQLVAPRRPGRRSARGRSRRGGRCSCSPPPAPP